MRTELAMGASSLADMEIDTGIAQASVEAASAVVDTVAGRR